MDNILALYAKKNGEIVEAPGIFAVGRTGEKIVRLAPKDLIPLPDGSDLMMMPDRRAAGTDRSGKLRLLPGDAVSAILPMGYTRSFLPAGRAKAGAAPLPLYGYTAVALWRDKICAAAIFTDENDKWDPAHYNTRSLKKLVRRAKDELKGNRLVDHLAHCSLKWRCFTAQNLFYRRWEAGLPISPVCNARCLGCISLQESGCCPSPQGRIKFRPSSEEAAEIGIYHLSAAPDGIISFGQGCEGEPSLAADAIADAIKKIRGTTKKGQININTNAGFTDGIAKIAAAGLDTMRVSIISAVDETYNAYYRAGYCLDNVKESLKISLDAGIYVSLNLLYFPGLSDSEKELSAWEKFIADYPVQMIQIRNLNIDPDFFLKSMPDLQGRAVGARNFIERLKNARPDIIIGNFSHFIG